MAAPRILAGSARGRPLATPPHGTRPSPARLRAALFDSLAFEPRGHFLDLYAGSGAVGLEAASRGWQVTMVERAAPALRVLRENARRCGLDARIVAGDALDAAQRLAGSVDVAFVDPPYDRDLEALFQTLLDLQLVRPGGRYVFQHPTALRPQLRRGGEGLELDTRRYGSNALSYLQV